MKNERTITSHVFTLCFLFLVLTFPVLTVAADGNSIVQQMKAAFESAQTSTRLVMIRVSNRNEEGELLVARQARTQLPNGKWSLLVMEQPADIKGTALVVWERSSRSNTMWGYLPSLQQVRQLVPAEGYQPFFATDLTYADLGFVEDPGTYRLLGEEQRNGSLSYKVELIPTQQVYYAQILTWVAQDTMLPIEREYYDVEGRLWKRITFDQVTTIDGIPTPLHIHIRNEQTYSSTDVTFRDVRYGVQLPDMLFAAQSLPETVATPWWQEENVQMAGNQYLPAK